MVNHGLYSYRQRVRVITLFPKKVFLLLCMLSEFANVFERKVGRVQVAHLHNAARALSSRSRCFHGFKVNRLQIIVVAKRSLRVVIVH